MSTADAGSADSGANSGGDKEKGTATGIAMAFVDGNEHDTHDEQKTGAAPSGGPGGARPPRLRPLGKDPRRAKLEDEGVVCVDLPRDVLCGYLAMDARGRWDALPLGPRRSYLAIMILTFFVQFCAIGGLVGAAGQSVYIGGFLTGWDNVAIRFTSGLAPANLVLYEDFAGRRNDTGNDTGGAWNVSGAIELLPWMDGDIVYVANTDTFTEMVKWMAVVFIVCFVLRDMVQLLGIAEFLKLHRAGRARQRLFVLWMGYLQWIISAYTLMATMALIYFSPDAMSSMLNCVAVGFVVELDNWVYDIVQYFYVSLTDELFHFEFEVSQEEQKRLMGQYEKAGINCRRCCLCWCVR